jgi:mono/diheme cytochrome c family protein
MDPLGFALDSFDAIGMERREDDWGYRLDLRGELDGESFNGLAELAWVLRNHPDAERCFTQHLFRYAEGRENESHDATALAWMTDAFASHSFRWKPMLSAFVASSAFRGSPGVEVPGDQTSTQATDDLATIQADVFGGSCAPCHTEAQFGELSLALDAGLRDRLLAPSKQVPTMALVTPGDPDASYLMHKLDGTHEDIGGQGTIMPPSEPVSTTTTERVRAWIAAGAQ